MLQELINVAKNANDIHHKHLNDTLAAALHGNNALNEITKKCDDHSKALEIIRGKRSTDEGTLNESIKILASAESGLENEIATLKGVIAQLDDLKKQSSARQLLSHIDAASLIDADPTAIQNVIDLLTNLVNETEVQLAHMRTNVDTARANLKASITELESSKRDSEECLVQQQKQDSEVHRLRNVSAAAENTYEDAKHRNLQEINQLNHVIKILEGLLSKN